MCYLIETVLPPDYYNFLIGVLTEDQILAQLIEIRFPQLKEQLDVLQMETSLFSIQMLVCLFTMHSILSDTIMDLLFIDGSVALLKGILTYLTLF